MMQRAFDELGYRRYAWQCNSLNDKSIPFWIGYTEGVQPFHQLVCSCAWIERDGVSASVVKGLPPVRELVSRRHLHNWVGSRISLECV